MITKGVTRPLSSSKTSQLSNNMFKNNLLKNGNFSNDSFWDRESAWSISDGVAIGVPAGTTSYMTDTSYSAVSGKRYEIIYEIKENSLNGTGIGLSESNGFVLVYAGDFDDSVGVHRIFVEATANRHLSIYSSGTNTTGQIVIDNISVLY